MLAGSNGEVTYGPFLLPPRECEHARGNQSDRSRSRRDHITPHAVQVTWVPHHDLSAVEAALQAGAIFRWLDS